MQMQRDAQVAACVDSTSRTVEVWGPTRQVLAMALYVGGKVRRSRGMAGESDRDTEMHRMRKVMAMVDYDGAAGRRAKGHTVQVVSPQASAEGAADQGVTDHVQDGHTWWVVEPRGDRRQAVVYTAAPLKRVGHPLMRWVGEVEEVRVERTEKVREKPVLRALESQIDRCAGGRGSGRHQGTDPVGIGVGGQQQGRGAAEVDSDTRHGGRAQEGGILETEKAHAGGKEARPGGGRRPRGGEAK